RGLVAALLVASLLATLATLRTDLGTAGGAEGIRAGQESRVTAVPRKREKGYGLVAFRGLGPERWYARWHALRELLATRTDGLVGLIAAFLCVHAHEAPRWPTNKGN